MPVSAALIRKISEIEPGLREILILILEEMEKQREQWEDSVTKSDFDELKDIVSKLSRSISELTEAQKRTEERVDKLEKVVAELVEAQKRTEERINELAEAQKRTEERVDKLEKVVAELAEAQKQTEEEIIKLSRGLTRIRQEVGGLSRSMAYALENEAYRHLPAFLKSHYGFEVVDRFIRTYVNEREVNIFGRVQKEGKESYVVGEAVLKLDDVAKLKQVWENVIAVKKSFGGEVIPILVTHFAKPEVLEKARKTDIIVVQSFEWI